MATRRILEEEQMNDLEELPAIRNLNRQQRGQKKDPRYVLKHLPQEVAVQLAAQKETQDEFEFSYHASRHERQWIANSLGEFYQHKWLEDVLRLIKGGKEAHVYQCTADPLVTGLERPYVAAKIYRPRRFRNLKNDHVYKEGRSLLDSDGRQIIDDRMLRAIQQHTAYGMDLMHTSWIEHEYKALCLLHEAGCDVPVPLRRGNNAILMAYIGGDEIPAPTLNSVSLKPKEARRIFERVLENIDKMLAKDCIHADLSAYNILYWQGQIRLIDFPQAIDPHNNRSAWQIFERDVIRICEYFERQGVPSQPRQIARSLWKAHGHRTSPDVHPALLDDQDEGDRVYWESLEQST
jgi:RIO kinase 1